MNMKDAYMNNMKAYHNDPKIKEDILLQLKQHYDADEIVKGIWWDNRRGCAVGCTLHSFDDYNEYEIRFGIPGILAYLEDRIFEKLPKKLSKEWPIRFMDAINVGADLSKVWNKFAIWILSNTWYGLIDLYIDFSKNKKIIKDVIDLHQRSITEEVSTEEFIEAGIRAANYGSFRTADYFDYSCDYSYVSIEKYYLTKANKLIQILKEAK